MTSIKLHALQFKEVVVHNHDEHVYQVCAWHIKYALNSSMLAINTYVLDNYPESLKLLVFIHPMDFTDKR